MKLLLLTLLVLSAQLLLASGACRVADALPRARPAGDGGRRRRRRAARARGARTLRRAAPVAGAVLAGGVLLALGGLSLDAVRPAGIAAIGVPGALACAGMALLLDAGRHERRGRLRAARVSGRLGGELACAGSLLVLVGLWSVVAADEAARRAIGDRAGAWIVATLATAQLAGAGLAAALAGISGKPRPAGWVAAVLYATATAACLATLRALGA